MSNNLTEQEFSKHIGTEFHTAVDGREVSLTLVQAKAYTPLENEQPGMERFSVFFDGPQPMLTQKTYSLRHERMGQFDIFLTPISGNADGFRYEAVFNYYKKDFTTEDTEKTQ